MWPRKQLDIGWTDLAFGLAQIVTLRSRPRESSVIGNDWMPAEEAIVSLSVRSAWDLLLTAAALPRGSEVLVSAVTIPDMVRIIEHHGLVPVPVDVDAQQLQPVIEHLERSITSRTRAILVAHLFGTCADVGPIVDFARQHDLMVVEDCAQAYAGPDYAGHPQSDASLFSFGPIKTGTALGGAVTRVRDARIRSRMSELQQNYRVQSRLAYLKRLVKYSGFRVLCNPGPYGLLVKMLGAMGIDYDRALGNAAHSFAPQDFFAQIRRQPCVPLVCMLKRRILSFQRRGAAMLRRRTMCGHRLSQALEAGMVVGEPNVTHTYWVNPLRAANREAVIAALRREGFDATTCSSLVVVAPENAIADGPVAEWLAETIFLPGGERMSDAEWQQMIAIVKQTAEAIEPARERELVAVPSVSLTT